MDWTEQLDDYCERTDAGLWSEPLNFASNAAFIVAAALAWRRYRRAGVRDLGLAAQIALLFAIGVGSALFHSVATRWAMIADVAPITALMFVYLGYFLRRVLVWPTARVVAGLVGFAVVSGLLGLIPRAWLNNSQSYLGTVAAMGVMASATWPTVGRRLALGAALFVTSLTLRSIDQAVCPTVPIGTHFLWHTLNGVLLYILVAAVIDERAQRAPVG
ncbi:MAG TPA: ceramidase domain-containing protein [Kofleriaceae bacterium]|nr:ceramidase domain-containing protein [Kofleriaceae bacterium]